MAIGLGIGIGVGAPIIIIIAIVVILVVKRQSGKANSVIELAGKKTSTQQVGNKVAPNADDFEDGKHTPLGSLKANDPSLTSSNMLTNPDMTADEQTAKNGKEEPAKFKSKPGNNQSKW